MNSNPHHVKHPSRAQVIARKRDEANARKAARAKLTDRQQLLRLDQRDGASTRETARLTARVSKEKTPASK